MKRTTMSDLCDHLFETIERLQLRNDPEADEKEKIDLETAQTICQCSQTIINARKLEVDALKIMSHCLSAEKMEDAMRSSNVLQIGGK